MKRILLIISLTLPFLTITAQVEWAPIGAKWYYTEPYQEELSYILVESVGDTTIHEYNCRILKFTRNGHEFVSQEYIAQRGDTILYYNPHTDGFHTLYNFAAEIGDTIHVHYQPFKPNDAFLLPSSILDDGIIPYFSYRIVGIASIEVSGIMLKQQEVDFLTNDDRWGFSNITGDVFLIEGIGSLTYFLGRGNWIVPEESVTLLRCYSDELLSYYNPLWESSCILISSIETKWRQEHRIFPNPTGNILHIELDIDDQEFSIQVVDIYGRIRIAEQVNQSSQLEMEHLEPGLYFLKISSKRKTLTHKILKI
jgi:hypothetical protein